MKGGRNKVIGHWGEIQAGLFLQRHGFTIIERNFFASMGEIDIVATKAGDYYFIEVKTRCDQALATDLAVTRAKRVKLEKTQRYYCYKRGLVTGSFILATVIVLVARPAGTVRFRFTVVY